MSLYPSVIGRSVTLSPLECDVVRFIGGKRSGLAVGAGLGGNNLTSMSNVDMDIEAFGAEVAACKLLNVYPDFTPQLKSVKDGSDKGDLVLPSGVAVDVKVSPYDWGNLLISSRKSFCRSINFFLLLTGKLPTYTFRGFIPFTKAVSDVFWDAKMKKPCYHVPQSELRELDYWLGLLSQSQSAPVKVAGQCKLLEANCGT